VGSVHPPPTIWIWRTAAREAKTWPSEVRWTKPARCRALTQASAVEPSSVQTSAGLSALGREVRVGGLHRAFVGAAGIIGTVMTRSARAFLGRFFGAFGAL
jgi:hypothetical protein